MKNATLFSIFKSCNRTNNFCTFVTITFVKLKNRLNEKTITFHSNIT